MPIRRFWAMSGVIPRIEAQRAMISLTVANAAQSQEGARNCREDLRMQMGIVYLDAPVRDEGATDTLKQLML